MSATVLITGANAGMGLTTTLLLAQHGYHVMAGARSEWGRETLQQHAAAQGLSITPLDIDVQKPESIEAAVHHALGITQRIDALVNNAGYGLAASVEDAGDDEFVRQFDVNVFGVLRMIRAVVPTMRRAGQGIIVNVGSFLGEMGLPLLAHYTASKYAVEGITDSLRHELRPFGIRVHTVVPGLFRTDFVARGLSANARTTDPASPYAPIAGTLLPKIAKSITEGPEPIAVAQAILRTIQEIDAPARVPVGIEAEEAARLKRELPQDQFEALMRERFGLPA